MPGSSHFVFSREFSKIDHLSVSLEKLPSCPSSPEAQIRAKQSSGAMPLAGSQSFPHQGAESLVCQSLLCRSHSPTNSCLHPYSWGFPSLSEPQNRVTLCSSLSSTHSPVPHLVGTQVNQEPCWGLGHGKSLGMWVLSLGSTEHTFRVAFGRYFQSCCFSNDNPVL